jgi:ethanolamine-phosphate cytidylyltransferase
LTLLSQGVTKDEVVQDISTFVKTPSKSQKSEISETLDIVSPSRTREPVRIYIDGAFDLIHSGHYNAIRQAKMLGDKLIVGVNSDAEILKNKGPPVLTCKERADILRACKWCDEVYEDTEYTVTIDTLDRYNC